MNVDSIITKWHAAVLDLAAALESEISWASCGGGSSSS